MTDITDKDKREARKWAEQTIANRVNSPTDPWVIAARLFLAAEEPPAPTLAEELRDTARWWRDGAPTWEQCCDRFDALATRAEQMEHDLTEARAEVERLTEEVEEWQRKAGLAKLDLAVEQRKMKRLAADVPRPMPPGDIPGTALPIHRTRRSNPKETLASSFPDPADVPSGEPWIVEVDGEHRTAVRGATYHRPWNTFKESGSVTFAKDHEITLVSRFVPAPRVITDPDELDKLAEGTIILGTGRLADLYRKHRDRVWMDMSVNLLSSQRVIRLEKSVAVLWEPEK